MKLKRTALAATIAATSLSIVAPSAYATAVLKVDGLTSPPADVTVTAPLVAGTTISFETDYNVPATCSTSAMSGYVKRGATVAVGAQIGAITSMAFTSCTMTSLNYPLSISKMGAAEWGIFATSTPASSAVATIPVEIRDVAGYWRGTGTPPLSCEFGFTGSLTGVFNQNTQVLSIVPATSTTYPTLIEVFNGAGTKTPAPVDTGTCMGQMYTGDRMQLTGSFQLATPGVGGIKLQ